MSAPLIYMKIHHNRLKPAPLNTLLHVMQPLPDTGLASLPHLAKRDSPVTRADLIIDTFKTASTHIALLSIAWGVHVLRNDHPSCESTKEVFPPPQRQIQGSKSAGLKPEQTGMQSAGPVLVIRSATKSTTTLVKAVPALKEAIPSRVLVDKDLARILHSVQEAVTSNQEAISSMKESLTISREEINSSRKAVAPAPPVTLTLNVTVKVPPQVEGKDNATKSLSLDRTTSPSMSLLASSVKLQKMTEWRISAIVELPILGRNSASDEGIINLRAAKLR